jgi:hypothetical protein
MTFLFSVYEDTETRAMTIIFRGQLREPLMLTNNSPITFRLFTLSDLPWEEFTDSDSLMLHRYTGEAIVGRFAIYSQYDDLGRFGNLEL